MNEKDADDVSSLLSISQTGNDVAEEYFIDVINDISDETPIHQTITADNNDTIITDKTVNLFDNCRSNKNALALAQSRLLEDTYAHHYTIPPQQEYGLLEEDAPISTNVTVRNRMPFDLSISDSESNTNSDNEEDFPIHPNITVRRNLQQSRYL